MKQFRSGDLSPVELMNALIRHAEENDARINSLTYQYFENALKQSRAAENRFRGKGASPRPLEGIPVAIKDSGHLKGHPTSGGSLATGNEPQQYTSPVNQRVLESGAIVHARTATPEFSSATFTHSKRWGVTRNPWNDQYTPGGSSGGAGSSLAAGFTTLATGSDIGGSIRIPASCCGVVGYKPPHGRNPVDPPFNFDRYCHTGPMARSVRDAILLQNVMCGPCAGDPTLIYPKLELDLHYPALSGLKVAWSMDFGFYEVDPVVRKNTLTALEVFKDAGAEVEEVEIPWTWEHHHAGLMHLKHIFGASIAEYLDQDADLMTDYGREFAESSRTTTSSDYFKSLLLTGEAGMNFRSATARFDIFVCPTTAIPAVKADYNHSSENLSINGNSVEPMLGWVMTLPFNMLSTHPVISVPSGYSAEGIPTGIQIVGQPYRDKTVFQAALKYEEIAGDWFITKDNHPVFPEQAYQQQANTMSVM